MTYPINALALSTLAAASALAQAVPTSSAPAPESAHVVGLAYTTSSVEGADGNMTSLGLSARIRVWENLCVVVERLDASVDVNAGGLSSIEFKRVGIGLGAGFQVYGGQVDVSLTHGTLQSEFVGLSGPEDADQTRLGASYAYRLSSQLSLSLGLTHVINGANSLGWSDVTVLILGAGYRFGNGLEVVATYSPDSSDVGAEQDASNAFSVGVNYNF